MASRTARALKNGPQQDVDNSLVRAQLGKRSKYDTNLIIHYTHEKPQAKKFINYGIKFLLKQRLYLHVLLSALETVTT